jgi:hypothetical protein
MGSQMRKAMLTRDGSSDDGTFGTFLSDSGFTCRTGELPWRDNAPEVSCIPPGVYNVTFRMSSKHGLCYHVENVPGRSGVEIHAANFCGAADRGKKCQLEGCLAPGLSVGQLEGQKAILESRQALLALQDEFAEEDFELTIE